MKRVLFLITVLATLNAGFVNPETDWEYQQSTFQGFYMLQSTQIDGLEAEATDVIGAFKDGVCVGWVYVDPSGFTTVPLMGNDGSPAFGGYMSSGDTAELFIYDATHGSILPLDLSATSVDLDGDFQDDLFGEAPGWSNNEIFILNGASSATNTFGCPDENACNYDSDVTADDGSCWSANEGCLCSDGEGSQVDCAGVCNGDSELDDCDVCDGGNADQDCAGVCFGDSSVDGCGVCDSDSSNDDVTCTGCTDECADNYDVVNLFDDGSCEYTIPGVENLSASSGPARVILSWDAPEICGPSLSYEVYDVDGTLVKETANTTTQILGLTPDTEYCFSVVALNANGSSENSDAACATPELAGGISWGLQLSAGINGWGMFDESDAYNYLGVAPNGSDDYDSGLDVPEPPMNSAANYISLHFTHEEWGSVFGNYFTQDVRLEDDEYFQSNLVVWEADVLSNMSGQAYILIEHFNTPLSVPIYAEFDGEVFAVEDGSMVEFFLQEGIPQTITISIGNIVPEAPVNLAASGGDRSIELDWDDDSGLYPATSYNVYRDGELIANVSDSNYFDDADMEGHEGQGLLYESSYDYTVTGVNDAGESTNGHQISNHDGSDTDVDGRQSDSSATTDDNIDPVSAVSHLASEDGTNISDGVYEIPHNYDIDANRITISIDGSNSDDLDEFDTISSYEWTQVSGSDVLNLQDSDSDTVSFEVSNANGSDDKGYTLNLHVTSDYPVKGGSATREANAQISITVQDEPNQAPVAPNPFDIIVGGDDAAVYTMDDDDDENDYDGDKSLWVVPHDGDPDSGNARLHFTESDAYDLDSGYVGDLLEEDELSYKWETGLDHEPFTDLNGDGEWSVNEPYEDVDEDGEWDDGDVFYNGLNLSVLREAGDYTFHLIVTDEYGASSSSAIVVGVEAEHNEVPAASAGADQEWFMPNGLDLKDITVDDNSGSDSDNDALSFSWSVDGFDGDSDSGLPALLQSLPEGDHTFTFTTTDSYGASASDDVTISILNEPASAAVTNLSTDHGLYYVEISFDEGVLEEDERYTGDLDNSVGYDIFRDGELLATLDDDGASSFYYLDNGISSSTTFSYDVQSFNSDARRGDSVSASETTGDRPTVEVLSPNGAEIWSVGDEYPIEVSTDNKEYISDIEIFYSADGGETWTSSGSIDADSESASISSDGSEINYDARVKVVVTDVGDFNNENKGSNEDSSDNSFTMAAHTLSKNYWTGWHMFGAPLVPSLETINDFMSSVGSFGSDWIIFNGQGLYQNLDLNLGSGYYLALSNNSVISIDGDPITTNNLELADLELSKGWNLVSHPLTSIVSKSELIIIDEGIEYSWDDAVYWGLISPTLYSWSNNSYQSLVELTPWAGFWVNTSRALTVKVRPHLPLDASARIADNTFSINLSAESVDGLSGGDFVKMSVKDGANDSFRYGEDEFDHPNPAMDSFIDLYFDKNEWLGVTDQNGVMVDNPYFSHDVRSLDSDAQAWNIKGNLYNVSGDIELNWTMNENDQEAHLLISGEVYDMREISSVTVSSLDGITVVLGDLEAYLAPSEFALSSSYPNPFNPSTSMDLSLNESGYVSVKVYNVMGQVVSTLVDGNMDAGYHTLTWNADNMPSGMYLVRVQAGSNVETQKLMLLK